jgi:hypothetical protein
MRSSPRQKAIGLAGIGGQSADSCSERVLHEPFLCGVRDDRPMLSRAMHHCHDHLVIDSDVHALRVARVQQSGTVPRGPQGLHEHRFFASLAHPAPEYGVRQCDRIRGAILPGVCSVISARSAWDRAGERAIRYRSVSVIVCPATSRAGVTRLSPPSAIDSDVPTRGVRPHHHWG